jgi:hypothetical protein
MPERPQVIIAMPQYGHVSPRAMASFVELITTSMGRGVVRATMFSQDCGLMDVVRNGLVVDCFQQHPSMTHIMWVDSDMVVPANAVTDLLARDKPVVGGLYYQKTEPFTPVVYEFDPFRRLDEPFENIRRVGGLGLGCTLVRSEIYKTMALHYGDAAWHQLSGNDGEDAFFFQRCKEMGIETWLDPAVRCGHVRDHVVTSEDWERARAAAAASAAAPVSGFQLASLPAYGEELF